MNGWNAHAGVVFYAIIDVDTPSTRLLFAEFLKVSFVFFQADKVQGKIRFPARKNDLQLPDDFDCLFNPVRMFIQGNIRVDPDVFVIQ